jgi:hypothetical protein
MAGSSGTNPIAPLWTWFATQSPLWWSGHVAFHGPRRTLTIDGTRWSIYFNVHANRRSPRSPKASFTAGIAILPVALRKPLADRVRRGGWLRALRREVLRHGYYGGWRDARWGGHGVFFKDLPNLQEVQAEVERMKHYDLGGALMNWATSRRSRS